MKIGLIETIKDFERKTKIVLIVWTVLNLAFALTLMIGAGAPVIPVIIFFLIWEFAVVGYYVFKYKYRNRIFGGDWIDAILFAVIAATVIRSLFIEAYTIPTPSMEKDLLVGDFLFVSKVNYGTRTTMTPLSFPFAHHTIGITNSKAYLEWMKFPYFRFPGFEKIENGDVVVFNYPNDNNDPLSKGPDPRPVDKKTNYIKRCVGIGGDSLQVKNGVVYINGVMEDIPEKHQYKYFVKTDGTRISQTFCKRNGITDYMIYAPNNDPNDWYWVADMTDENAKKVEQLTNVKWIKRSSEITMGRRLSNDVHPRSMSTAWTTSNYGPIYIPKKGDVIQLNDEFQYRMYEVAIRDYEDNPSLEWNANEKKAYLDGKVLTEYKFKMDYYFMMGDNRDNSADSRVWGYVPEDHVVGKASIVWWSVNREKVRDKNGAEIGTKFKGIRWRRIFKLVH